MTERLAKAVARARDLVATLAPALVDKGIWGSPMGKTRIADRIAAELPEHRVYVEPFAGGAQVLFAKEPSEVEVVSDLDPEIAFAFKFVRGITPDQLVRLRRKKWVGDKAHFKKLVDAGVPDDDLERFYRFAYLSRFSFNKLRRGTMPDKNVGIEARFVEKLERHAPRLKKVRVRCADYEKVIDEFDGPDTFFFLDPPYAGYDGPGRSRTAHGRLRPGLQGGGRGRPGRRRRRRARAAGIPAGARALPGRHQGLRRAANDGFGQRPALAARPRLPLQGPRAHGARGRGVGRCPDPPGRSAGGDPGPLRRPRVGSPHAARALRDRGAAHRLLPQHEEAPSRSPARRLRGPPAGGREGRTSVTKTGDWALARRILSAGPVKLKAAIGTALRQEAQLLRKEIVQGITNQAPGGEAFKPLSPLTIAARQLKGRGGSKALMVHGDLRNSIAVIVQGDEAFVGVPRKARGRNGRSLVDVAQVQEFGSNPIVIPVTARMRRFLFAMLKQAGKEPQPGSGKGVVVVTIPARPFLRPAFRKFSEGAQQRFLGRVARLMGWGAA